MSSARGILGASLGAAVAVVGLRVAAIAKQRGVPVTDIVSDLPDVLADDARHVAASAKAALRDGREAAHRARNEFDMQVVAHARRTKGHDV